MPSVVSPSILMHPRGLIETPCRRRTRPGCSRATPQRQRDWLFRGSHRPAPPTLHRTGIHSISTINPSIEKIITFFLWANKFFYRSRRRGVIFNKIRLSLASRQASDLAILFLQLRFKQDTFQPKATKVLFTVSLSLFLHGSPWYRE